jgi:hypothetical protein
MVYVKDLHTAISKTKPKQPEDRRQVHRSLFWK